MIIRWWFSAFTLVMCACYPMIAQEDAQVISEAIFADKAPAVMQIADTDQLLDIHDSRVKDLIPILVPDASYRQTVDLGLVIFYESGFPDSFVNTLAKHGGVEYAESGVVVYPIFIRRSRNGDYILETENLEKATLLTRVKPAPDWDKFWYARQHFAKYYPSEKISRSVFTAFHNIHNELRVEGWMRLVTPSGKKAIDEYEVEEQFLRESAAAAIPVMMTMSGGGSPTDFRIFVEKNTTNSAKISIEWPTGCISTNMVDFFTTTNLLQPLSWEIALTTNINLSSNSFSWIDAISPDVKTLFYDVWTLADSDGDGASDGRETRLWNTDISNWDTDGDGMPDGWETTFGLDPLSTNGVNGVNGDPDGDGLANLEEYQYNTSPLNADSDNDSISDGDEVANGSVPVDADDNGDPEKCVSGPFYLCELLWPEYEYVTAEASRRYCAHIAETGYAIYSKDWNTDNLGQLWHSYASTQIPLMKGKKYTFSVENTDVRHENDYYDYTAYMARSNSGYDNWGADSWGVYVDDIDDLFAYERTNVNPEGRIAKVTILGVDLVSSKVDDGFEDESPGCVMSANSNNLEQFDITIPSDVSLLPNLNLTFDWKVINGSTWNTSHVSIWSDQSKTIQISPSNSWPIGSAPTSIYVEGVIPSQIDLYARLVDTREDSNGNPIIYADLSQTSWQSFHAYDRIKVSVVSVDLEVNNTSDEEDDYIVKQKPAGARETPVNEPAGATDNHIPMKVHLNGPSGFTTKVKLSATGGGSIDIKLADDSDYPAVGADVTVGTPLEVKLYGTAASSDIDDVLIEATTEATEDSICGEEDLTVIWIESMVLRGSGHQNQDFTSTSEAQLTGSTSHTNIIGIIKYYLDSYPQYCNRIRNQMEIAFTIAPSIYFDDLGWSLHRECSIARWYNHALTGTTGVNDWELDPIPYGLRTQGWDGDMAHSPGDPEIRLFAVDTPALGALPYGVPPDAPPATYKGKFREWAEVKIGSHWYVCSEHLNWRTILYYEHVNGTVGYTDGAGSEILQGHGDLDGFSNGWSEY